MPSQPLTSHSIDPAAALIEKKRQKMEAAAVAKDDNELQRVEDELRKKLRAMLLETERKEQEELRQKKELEAARLESSKKAPSSKRFRSSGRRSGRRAASSSGSTRSRPRLGSSGSMRARRRRRDGVNLAPIIAITLGLLLVGGAALLFWL